LIAIGQVGRSAFDSPDGGRWPSPPGARLRDDGASPLISTRTDPSTD